MPTDPSAAPADVLVAFASRHGATRGVAERIAARLRGDDRDWTAVDAWADGIAEALAQRPEPAGAQ